AATHEPALPPPAAESAPLSITPTSPQPVEEARRWGNRCVTIEETRLLGSDGERQTVLTPESALTIEMQFDCPNPIEDVVFGIGVFREDGLNVYGTNTSIERHNLTLPLPERGVVR